VTTVYLLMTHSRIKNFNFVSTIKEKKKMKNLTNNKKVVVSVMIFLIMAVFASTLYSQEPANKPVDPTAVEKMLSSESAIKNLEMALNSENPGLKISAIRMIGKYRITAFEDQLVEKLNDSDNFKEQRAIAVSLYNMGTLSSIASLIEYGSVTESENMKSFCDELIAHYEKEEVEKANYVNSLVIDSEISQ
jgi:hypothetical protein